MFLRTARKGYIGTEQYISGDYMALFDVGRVLYAGCRKLALKQLGHFMMGTFRIGGVSITVSGPCGSDGLPCVWERLPPRVRLNPEHYGLVRLPVELSERYWKDDTGWNDAGAMTEPLREWGRKTFPRKSNA